MNPSAATLPNNPPIFIVGCGRSGTTLLYELLSCHEDLAWFSTYTNKWPAVPQLASLSRLYPRMRLRGKLPRYVPRPVEGYAIWDSPRTRSDADLHGPLAEEDVAEQDRTLLTRAVNAHVRWQGARIFLNKNTRNIRRVPYLRELFRDLRVIHVVRDPRPTVASLLHVEFWESLRVWSENYVSPREWRSIGGDDAALAASLWVADLSEAMKAKVEMGSRWLDIRYEDLVANPLDEVKAIVEFCSLPWSSRLGTVVNNTRIASENDRYRERLTSDQIDLVAEKTTGLARSFGYDLQP